MSSISASCVFLFFFLASCLGECPDGYTVYHNQCYRVFRNAVPWYMALFNCEQDDARLAEFETRAKITDMHKLVTVFNMQGTENFWIGMTDAQHEGKWVWEYGHNNVTHFDWGHREPNQGSSTTQQDCAFLYGREQFKWADGICDNTMGYVCQRPLNLPL